MIFDYINNSSKYKRLSDNLAIALSFISNTNLQNLDVGKYSINSDDVFYTIDEYKAKPSIEGKLEAHKKYIDIQTVISGSEYIGHALLSNQKILRDYDDLFDYALYQGDATFIKLVPGSFAIFYPSDLHMPGIDEYKINVKKMVIKVRI